MAIEIKNIKKQFKNNLILDGIDLSIEKGDVIGIIGPSGTGKSTLLRAINRLVKPESGSIVLSDGTEIDLVTAKGKDLLILNQFTGMVFQSFNLFDRKTALENVMEGLLVVKKMGKKQAQEIALKHLEDVGLSDWQNHYPKHLSGGQQQRVAIARALAMQPELLLLDEPTSALDPEFVGEVLVIIKKAVKESYTMLLVSHEMNFIRNVATKVVFLDNGKILEQGTPHEMFEHPKHDRVKEFFEKMNRLEDPEYYI